jgi:hypothetical protein
MRLEQILLLAGVIGVAAWRVYRMSKGMAYHYRRYRQHNQRKRQGTNDTRFRF